MLALCSRFFTRLNEQGVRYCHWKSNEHLDKALQGKTDLDVLVHTDDQAAFETALQEFDLKQVMSPPEKQFPGFEDYLGFDADTGELIHLHVHYRLILGQKYVKNHHLPLEPLFFDNLVQARGVNIPCPELELLLLIIRAHLKVDLVALAKHAVKGLYDSTYTALPQEIESELRALNDKCSADGFSGMLTASGLPLSEEQCRTFLGRLADGKLRFYHLWWGYHRVLRQLRPYRRDRSLLVHLKYMRLYILNTRIGMSIWAPNRKTLPGTGRVFSIVGADGSGKSTLIGDIGKWLSWKLTVKRYYYGIPKNWVAGLNSLAMRVLNKVGLRAAASLVCDLFWIYVARYRRSVYRKSTKCAAAGQVVVSDRFPMPQFRNMREPMDNPRIDGSRSKLRKRLRAIEERYYADIRLPDRIVALQVELAELRRRKRDIGLEQHEVKATAVNGLRGDETIVLIDANRPYEEVLRQVKASLWQAI